MTKNAFRAVIIYAIKLLAYGTPNANARLMVYPDINTILFFFNCHLCDEPGRL
jgi:hypothetical protein